MNFLILSLISFSVFGQYLPHSKIGESTDGMTIENLKQKCEKRYSEPCVSIKKIGNHPYSKLADERVEDKDSPLWGQRSLVEPCGGEINCKEKALNKECIDERQAYYNEEYSEVWCNEIVGYNTKLTGRKIVVEDPTKKALYEQAQAEKEVAKQAKSDRKEALKAIAKDKAKDLSKEEIEEFFLLLME